MKRISYYEIKPSNRDELWYSHRNRTWEKLDSKNGHYSNWQKLRNIKKLKSALIKYSDIDFVIQKWIITKSNRYLLIIKCWAPEGEKE